MKLALIGCLVCFIGACVSGCVHRQPEVARVQQLLGTRATYCTPPRKSDGRVDAEKLVSQLVELEANTYSFCIHSRATDWEDLKIFLPVARAHQIRVWASIVPPSESPPHSAAYAEPFRLDYIRWAREFAQLSLREPNLVAWSIDDFTHNLKKTFTPEYVAQMQIAGRSVNPRLAFVPCCYYPAITPGFITNYAPLIDGILFPYRHESAGANLKDAILVGPELAHLKQLAGPAIPFVLDIYASPHSRLGGTTPEYLEQVMTAGHKAADGVMIYCHQDPQSHAEKFQIVKRQFRSWAEADRISSRRRDKSLK